VPRPSVASPIRPGASPTRAEVPTAGAPDQSAPPAATATPIVAATTGAATVAATPAGKPTAEPTAVSVSTGAIPVSLGTSRFAVVLLGYGGPNHDGPYLTDSIVVVVVDPVAKTLTLLSVPRDSWVPLSFDGAVDTFNKINTAYAFAKDPSLYPSRLARYSGDTGPGTFAAATISRVTGIPISYYLGLDFDGFRAMIDTVGGIDVNVPDSFTSSYPANDDPSVDASWITVSFTAGPEHMNGERAIEFARAREVIDNPDEASDFARSRRQRIIMEAFKDRLLQPGGLIHLPQLLGIAASHVDTNYSLPGYRQLAQLILDWKDVKIYQTAISATNYLQEATGPDGAYALVPSNASLSWAPVRAFGRRLWNDPELGVEMSRTRVVVVNASGEGGLANRVSAELSDLGYAVGSPGTAPVQASSELIDQTGGKAPRLLDQLAQDTGLSSIGVSSGAPADAPEVSLVLGTDAVDLALKVPTDVNAPASVLVGPSAPDAGPTPPAALDVISPAPRRVRLTPTPVPIATPTQAPIPTPAPRATAIPVPGQPNLVVVPQLVGLPAAEAQQVINESGLMTTYVNYQTIDQVADHRFFLSIPVGHVLSQQPPPGTRVTRDTKIAIAIRKS
jgi:LCP family protein required for cell wall assembly